MGNNRGRSILLLCAFAALSACGGGSSHSGSTVGATFAPSTTASQQFSSDLAAAQQIVLRPSDVPPAWTSTPHDRSTNASDKKLLSGLKSCLGVSDSPIFRDDTSGASADAPDLDQDQQAVKNSVTFNTDRGKVDAGFGILDDPKFPPCMNSGITTLLQDSFSGPQTQGAKLGKVSTAVLNLPSVGDRSIAFRTTAEFTVKGLSPSAYVDVVFIQRGRIIATLTFSNLSPPSQWIWNRS